MWFILSNILKFNSLIRTLCVEIVTSTKNRMLKVNYLKVFIVTIVIHRGKSEQLVSHDEAVTKCASKGGLAPATWFPGVPHTVSYPDEARTDVKTYGDFNYLQLNEGESAWVGGYAQYGHTLVWDGCYIVEDYTPEPLVLNGINKLFECSTVCAYKNRSKIGVNSQHCWCFEINELNRVGVLQKTNCSFKKETTRLIGVYNVKDEYHAQKAQCFVEETYYDNDNNKMYNTVAESCTYKHAYVCRFEKTPEKDICTQPPDIYKRKGLCLMKESTSWSTSFETCVRLNGHLVSNKTELVGFLHLRTSFWLGGFRPFIINTTTHMTDLACLMVTRIGRDLFLEPDNCLIKRQVLCANQNDTLTTFDLSNHTNMIAGVISLVCVILIIAFGVIAHKRRTGSIKKKQSGGLNLLDAEQTPIPLTESTNADNDHSCKEDPDYNDPVDIYYTIDDALLERPENAATQRYKFGAHHTAKQSMDIKEKDEADFKLPADALATTKDDSQLSVYNVASNYPHDKPRDTNCPKNVYSHCVMVRAESSNDYDVASNI